MLVVILQDHNSNNAAKIFMQMQYDTKKLKNGSKLTYKQTVHATLTETAFTATSKKVVGKSARNNPKRDCGWF